MTEMQHKLCQFLRKTTNHSFPKYKRVVLVSASEHGIEHGINKVLPSAHMSSKTDWNLSQKFSNSSLFLPSCSTFPLLGISFTNPLSCHCANVVLGIKVSFLYFSTIYNEYHVIYCNAVLKEEKRNATLHLCKLSLES